MTAPAGVGAAAGPAAGSCPRDAVTLRDDGWSAINAPLFPLGEPVLTDYAADLAGGRVLFVTNGWSVMRTVDGGCRWTEVYQRESLDPRGEAGARGTITQLGIVGGNGADLVYLASQQESLLPGGSALAPTVALSRDRGATWENADRGLPALGTIDQLIFARDGQRGYALVQGAIGDQPFWYTTSDGGDLWALQAERVQQGLADLVPGRAPDEFWGWDENRLYHSQDAGQSLSVVEDVSGPVTAVSAASSGKTPVVFTTKGRWTSSDGGGRWRLHPFPGSVTSAAVDPHDGLVAAAGPEQTWTVVASGAVSQVGPVGTEHLRSVAIVKGRSREIIGLTRTALFRGPLTPQLGRARPAVPPLRLPSIPPITLIPGTGQQVTTPTLRPAQTQISLDVGAQEKARYTLSLPPTPTPLDVFFLVDTTNSFQPVIDGLRVQIADIVNRLSALRLDPQVGVGAFREYPVSDRGAIAVGENYPYRLVRAIGPVGDELEQALFSLRTGGGTGDGRTSALAATYQAATGAGQRVAPTSVDDGYVIPAGLDAKFRPGATKVLLLITDTEPRNASPTYPGPSVDAVGQALAGRGVTQVGLIVGEPPVGTPNPRATMERLAAATGALASADGIDCDGDGVADIEPDQPLVCDLQGQGLTTAILQLLRGVREEAPVELHVTGDARVVAPTSALVHPSVNVKAYAELPFDVTFSCGPDVAGRSFPVTFDAVSRDRTLATASALVQCQLPLPPPPADPPPDIPPPLPQAAAVLVPVPPPPVAPIVHPNPLPNPNVNPQIQPNLHAQAGMAANEQSQPKLALAGQDSGAEEQLAMSDHRHGDSAAVAALLLGAAACAMVALGASLRHRPALRRQSL